MSVDRFAGHTPGPMTVYTCYGSRHGVGYEYFEARNDSGLVGEFSTMADAELFSAAPELLAENKRLRAEIELHEAAAAADAHFMPQMKDENERLRARVAGLEEAWRTIPGGAL